MQSCHICDWVMSHVWMSHVTQMQQHDLEVVDFIFVQLQLAHAVMSRLWSSHVTRMNESCHTNAATGSLGSRFYLRAIATCPCSHVTLWLSHVTRMNGSCHTLDSGISQIWMSHATHEWDMSHVWMSHATHMNESCHKYERDMSHMWMSHVTHMYAGHGQAYKE